MIICFLEERRHRAQHCGFPLAELVGMDAVFGSDLGQGLVVSQDLSDDLRLENGGETSTGCRFVIGVSLSSAHLILAVFTV